MPIAAFVFMCMCDVACQKESNSCNKEIDEKRQENLGRQIRICGT